jgi:hypothetical protein
MLPGRAPGALASATIRFRKSIQYAIAPLKAISQLYSKKNFQATFAQASECWSSCDILSVWQQKV